MTEIKENNKLIAEFMGYAPEKGNGSYPIECPHDGVGFHLETMKYHWSWDWLMPVVEKIWAITGNRASLFYFDISEYTGAENDVIFNKKEPADNITDCYNAVIEFIKWYNNGNE